MIGNTNPTSRNYSTLTTLNKPVGHNTVISLDGSLVTALRLSGRNAESLTQADLDSIALIVRNIFAPLADNVGITFFQINLTNISLPRIEGGPALPNAIRNERIDYLTKGGLNRSEIYLLLEYGAQGDAQSMTMYPPTIVNALRSGFNLKLLWKNLKYCFSERNAILYSEINIERQKKLFEDQVESIMGRLSLIMTAEHLSLSNFFHLCQFLVTYDKTLLFSTAGHPEDEWYNHLANGDAEPVTVNNMQGFMLRGRENIFVRFGSLKRKFIVEHVEAGMFAAKKDSPFSFQNDSVFMVRFQPLSPLQKLVYFRNKKKEVERMSVKIKDMLTGTVSGNNQTLYLTSNMQREKELDEAQNIPEKWGMGSCHFALFGDPASITNSSSFLQGRFENAGASVIWESEGVHLIYHSMQACLPQLNVRQHSWNLQQFCGMVPLFKDSQGDYYCNDIDNIHAFPFTTRRGAVHFFSLWSGGVGINVGCGASRRGKTFVKNAIATHFGFYNGMYRAVDIDSGTETVAQLYEPDSSIIDINPTEGRGFNPFALLNDDNRSIYKTHLKSLVVQMLGYNSSTELRQLDKHDEMNLEQIINMFVGGGQKEQFLDWSHFYSSLNADLRDKLLPYFEGSYETLYQANKDAFSSNPAELYTVYNLQHINDVPVMKRLAMNEIFFRTKLMFSNPKFRNKPKYIDFDEAHSFLEHEDDAHEIASLARTGGKNAVGVGLWSQHPGEFTNVAEWDVIRKAANSLMFFSDYDADYGLYENAFNCTKSEVDTIRQLQPRRELLLIRRGLGISEVCILDVNKTQYAINTSQPLEAMKRTEFIKQYGFKKGINLTVEWIDEQTEKHNKQDEDVYSYG